MTYLTYTEYKELGGNIIDEAAFNRNIDRACAMIDNRTQSRLVYFRESISRRSQRKRKLRNKNRRRFCK